MRTPRNLNQALRNGFEITAEGLLSGTPETDRRVKGKLFLELGSSTGIGTYEFVVPYTATYHVAKPRAARLNEKGF